MTRRLRLHSNYLLSLTVLIVSASSACAGIACDDGKDPFLKNGKCVCADNSTVEEKACKSEDTPGVVKSGSQRCPSAPFTGTLVDDSSWTSGVCTFSGDVTVAEGTTLTIRPGVVVKMGSHGDYQHFKLKVLGELNVEGTMAAPVVFTATSDDSHGGDSNGDEGATKAAPGQTYGVWFEPGSYGRIQHAQFLYASDGVRTDGASPELRDVVFRNCRTGISAGVSDGLTVESATFTGCSINGLQRRPGTVTTDAVWDQASVVHTFTGDVTVAPNATLTLKPGLIIKAGAYHDYTQFALQVEGKLVVEGTEEEPVTMTATTNDSVGGDTNGDEGATQGQGYTNAIRFKSGSEGVLRWLHVNYASTALTVDGAKVSATKLKLTDCRVAADVKGSATDVSITESTLIASGTVIQAGAGSRVRATDNWWGSAAAPGMRVMGDVTFEPFKTAAP